MNQNELWDGNGDLTSKFYSKVELAFDPRYVLHTHIFDASDPSLPASSFIDILNNKFVLDSFILDPLTNKISSSFNSLIVAALQDTYLSIKTAHDTYLPILDLYSSTINPTSFADKFTNLADPTYLHISSIFASLSPPLSSSSLSTSFTNILKTIFLPISDLYDANSNLVSKFTVAANQIYLRKLDIVGTNGLFTSFITDAGDKRYLRTVDLPNYLSSYVTTTWLTNNYYNKAAIDALLLGYQPVVTGSTLGLKTFTKPLSEYVAVDNNTFTLTFNLGREFNIVPRAFVTMSSSITGNNPETFSFIIRNISATSCTVVVRMANNVGKAEQSQYLVSLVAFA